MKNSRLFKVFTALCMVVGMLFNVRTIKAEGDPAPETNENNTQLFGSITVGVTGQRVYDVTLPESISFNFDNYDYSVRFASTDETPVISENKIDDELKAKNNLSNGNQTLRINPGIVGFPVAGGDYSVAVVVEDGSQNKTVYQLMNGDSEVITIPENQSSPSQTPSGGNNSDSNNNPSEGNSNSGAIEDVFSLSISESNFVMTALGDLTFEGFVGSGYQIAFSSDDVDPTRGPSRELKLKQSDEDYEGFVVLSDNKKTATFPISALGFVKKGYKAFLAKINRSEQGSTVDGDYYDLGFTTTTALNVDDIIDEVTFIRGVSSEESPTEDSIFVKFNDAGVSAFTPGDSEAAIDTVHVNCSLTAPNAPSLEYRNDSVALSKDGNGKVLGISFPRAVFNENFGKFMYGTYSFVLEIRADNKPTYYGYKEEFNIGLPKDGVQYGTLESLDSATNQKFKIVKEPQASISPGSYRFILTDTSGADHKYYSSINFENNQYVFDTTSFSPTITEQLQIKKIAMVSFVNGKWVTNVNHSFSNAVVIKPGSGLIKGTCVLEPYSDPNNFSLFMTCTNDENPTDPVVVKFADNSAYELHVFNENTNASDIGVGKNPEGMIDLLTINKNSGTNIVSINSSNLNIGTSGINPSGQPKKYAFVVSKTVNNQRVPSFYGIIRNSNEAETFIGPSVLTLNNIMLTPPTVTISKGNYYQPDPNKAEIPGYYIECASNDKNACDTYLTKYYNNEGPSNDPMFSQMMFTNMKNMGRGVRPMEELSDNEADHNTELVSYLDPVDNKTHKKLFISTAILEEIGIEDGLDDSGNPILDEQTHQPVASYTVKICLAGYLSQSMSDVFFDTNLQSSKGIELEFVDSDSEWVTLKFANNSRIETDYFESITNMNFNAGNIGSTSPIDTGDGGNAVIATDKKSMRIKKSTIAITSGERVTAKIYSNKYSYQVATLTLKDGFTKVAPNDLVTSVKTDGVHVYTTDTTYLNGLTELNIRVDRKGAKTVIVDSPSQIDKSKVGTDHEAVFKLTQAQLNTLKGMHRPDNAFWTYTVSTGYVTYWNHSTLSVNPTLFGASITQMNQNPVDAPNAMYDDNLATSDEYVQNLKNGYVVKAFVDNGVGSVTLSGAISASIASNNVENTLYIDEVDGEKKQAIVNEKVEELDANGVKAVMDYFVGRDFKETGTAFSIELSRDGKPITDLAYPILINMTGVKDGNYKLLSVHDGVKREIKVTVSDGIAHAYSSLFSDFVLVEDNEALTPSKKESSSSTSSSTKKTDNVVTCQMAGYPANYAWNEAAKACQPGYINDNGVFVSTVGTTNSNRVKAVNTWDNGLGGSITALIASTMAALFAAYALRKWN